MVYIRDVGVPARAARVGPLAAALRRDTGVELLLVPDYLAAATHAAAHGFITAEALAGIRNLE